MGGGGGSFSSSDDDLTILEKLARDKLREGAERRNVFISFAYEDVDSVNLLRGQSKHEKSDLDFNDFSVKEPFDSNKAEYIRDKIREKIRQSSVTMVFISNDTAASRWVDWEIRESKRLGKGIISVYQGSCPSTIPNALREFKVKPIPWEHEAIMNAVKRAAQ